MRYFSFDIFDTCLIRTCGTPENLFDILSKMVFKQTVSESIRQDFIIARRDAEYKLYYNNPSSNIYDIYKLLSFDHPYLWSTEELIKKELDLERNVLVPVLKIRELITKLRHEGHSILFVSDMYLPASFLIEILLRYDLYRKGDKVFISCEVGKTKLNGDIYKHIHETEKIPYNKWTHYGDNKRSDIIEPHKLGIKTVFVNHSYSLYEQKWINNGAETQFRIKHIVAGISRSLFHFLPDHPRKRLLLDIIAPLYVSFVGYVFEESQRLGIKHLFFCARDTYQMYQVAQVIQKKYEIISIHYMRVSRTVLNKEDPNLILKFFEQEGLASNHYRSAIIDSSTSGGSFKKINQILTDNYYAKAYGFFLVKWTNSFINDTAYTSIIKQQYVNNNKRYSAIFKNNVITLLENIFSSNSDNRTIGYYEQNNKIIPLYTNEFDNEDCAQQDIASIQSYHTMVLTKYTETYLSLNLTSYSSFVLHNLAVPIFSQFIYYPTKEYTESLFNCFLKESGSVLPYIKKETLFRLIRTLGHDTCWSRATIFYNTPKWIHPFLLKYIDEKESR